jgi:hypothetical protein
MDNYLANFTEELDEAFAPETLFPDKELSILGWLNRKFFGRKNEKQQQDLTSTVFDQVGIDVYSKKVSQTLS